MLLESIESDIPEIRVDVVEEGIDAVPKWLRCAIDENLSFDISKLESFFFARWEPVLYDAFVVAAAVEFCDMTKRRPSQGWGRSIVLRIPVHDPDRWSQNSVANSLCDALRLLTGDYWELAFYKRKKKVDPPRQGQFNLHRDISAVIPFSDGLDSSIVAGLEARNLGEHLVRVRLGKKDFVPNGIDPRKEPFTAMPYKVRQGEKRFVESSARSRGFKFALISGIAAFLSGAKRVILPESGQGALGPSLIPVGQAYPDYRCHPHFGRKMETFLWSLIKFDGQYDYPYIWNTKGETLADFMKQTDDSINWKETRSCWQQNRQIGVDGKARQCGICAACMLRRLSVHAAGQTESASTYVWENLAAPTFESGVTPKFGRTNGAMREYAIAGTLHMDHLASLLQSRVDDSHIKLEIFRLSQSLDLDQGIVKQKLERLLLRHKQEWEDFVTSLGEESFITHWTKMRSDERA